MDRLKTKYDKEFLYNEYFIKEIILLSSGVMLNPGDIVRGKFDAETKIFSGVDGILRGRYLECECDLHSEALDFKEYIRDTNEYEVIEADRPFLKKLKTNNGFGEEQTEAQQITTSITKEEIEEKYKDMFAEGWASWIDVAPGWFPIVDGALRLIKHDIEHNKMPDVKLNQVKEKFGRLEMYFEGGNDRTWGIVSMATSMSTRTCEKCGTNQNIGQTMGWITTLCESCAKELKKEDKFKLNKN